MFFFIVRQSESNNWDEKTHDDFSKEQNKPPTGLSGFKNWHDLKGMFSFFGHRLLDSFDMFCLKRSVVHDSGVKKVTDHPKQKKQTKTKQNTWHSQKPGDKKEKTLGAEPQTVAMA